MSSGLTGDAWAAAGSGDASGNGRAKGRNGQANGGGQADGDGQAADDGNGSAGPQTEALVALARGGDRRALAVLLARYERRVLGFVRRRLGRGLRTSLESSDVVQEVMLQAVRSMDRMTPTGDRAFLRWLCGVVDNRLKNLARTRERHGLERAGTAVLNDLSTPPEAKRREDQELVQRALGRLSARHEEVIRLRHYRQLSFREIGLAMERTEKAAGMLHSRAMAELSAALHELRAERPRGS